MKKVLIVDDSQAEVHLMQTMLQKGGFQVSGVFDSTKAEEAIEEECAIRRAAESPFRAGREAQ